MATVDGVSSVSNATEDSSLAAALVAVGFSQQLKGRPCRRVGVREFSVNDEIVIVPPPITGGTDASQRAASLNRSGRAIWELCDGSRSESDIVRVLADRYSADPAVLAREVRDTLASLVEMNLIDNRPLQRTAGVSGTTFVIGIEDKPYFWWQTAIFLESFSGKLPAGWHTLVVVCNNGEPLSHDLKRILDRYDTKLAEGANHAKKYPLDIGSEAGAHHAALNRIEALSVASMHVDETDLICLLDSDTFLYRDLNLDVMPSGCAAPWNWHINQSPFFSSETGNGGNGVDLQKLLESIGCSTELKPCGVNIFVTGDVARNKKFVADCFRFAQVLFLLGRIAGLKKIWTAEMPCFALAMTANGIPYQALEHQELRVPSCAERSIPPGSIYHYYSDPSDFGRSAFLGSKWHKQSYRKKNFLQSDFREFAADATSASTTDHERYFFDLAERARKRIYMRQTPRHLVQHHHGIKDEVPLLGLGFFKTNIDRKLHDRLLDHLNSNRHKFHSEPANDYVQTDNEISFPSLLYQDEDFNHRLLSDLQEMHEKWSGLTLKKAACYGIRVYQPGSYLYSHTDRPTHVVSSTICVAHRLNNRWPLYIEDLEGRPHEIDVEPGEIVFFEGARLSHGRPYALDGESYANIFVHYTPTDLTTGVPNRMPK